MTNLKNMDNETLLDEFDNSDCCMSVLDGDEYNKLLNSTRKIRAEILRRMSGEWVSVDTPPTKEQCLKDDEFLIWPHKDRVTAHYNPYKSKWYGFDENGYTFEWGYVITHYMPLPQPPKERDETTN